MSEPHPRSSAASPFQRRLGLLAVAMFGVVAVLGLRHAWLSLVNGELHRRVAMAALSEVTILPTIRGTILDARGEILAEDRAPGLAVELAFALVDEEAWVSQEATRKAREMMDSATWRRLTPVERAQARAAAMPEAAARRSSLLRHVARESGLTTDELERRLAEIRTRVASLSRFVRERQRLAWAAEALGTSLARLEQLAVDGPSPGGPWFDAAAVAALGLPASPDAVVVAADAAATVTTLRSLEDLLRTAEVDPSGFSPRPIREEVGFHDVASPVDRVAANAIAVAANTFGMDGLVRLRDARLRVRPWTDGEVLVEVDGSMLPGSLRFDERRTVSVRGLGSSIIGTMSSVQAEDVAARPFDAERDRGGYRPLDDRVGRTGLEGVLEDELRGERGLRRDRVRLLAESVSGVAEDETVPDLVPRIDGADVRATIDVRLQARIRAALHPSVGLTLADPAIHGTSGLAGVGPALGHPLAVGVAVLEVATGDVLALVNGPNRAELPDPEMDPIIEEPGWLELDIAGRWGTTPGSTIKPLILAAAVSEGFLSADQTIECTGHYFPGSPDVARCWIHRPPAFATHGPLDGPEALANSCNIYFHAAADAFRGHESRLVAWLESFGFGRRPGGSPMLGPGLRPSAASISGTANTFERIMVGTGQAAMSWTPLQAAAAYASFLRGGDMPEPRIVAGDAGGSRDPLRPTAEAVWAVTEGLERGVNRPGGTAYRITADGIRHRIFTPDAEPHGSLVGSPYESVAIWGKTGTAQQRAVLRLPVEADADATGPDADPDAEATPRFIREVRTLSHGWFVGVVSGEDEAGRPREYAIAVLVRWGGSGGATAGPIANQVILALMQEGWLPMEPGLRPTSIGHRSPVELLAGGRPEVRP